MNVRRSLVFPATFLFLLATGAMAVDHPDVGAHAPPPPSRVGIPLDAAARAGLPREAAAFTAHGKTRTCEGVALAALLRHVGAMPSEPLRGPDLARRVEAVGRDGYRVTFSLAELDSSLGNRRVLLADRCDDQALTAEEGPLRLVVPEDARPARSLRQLQTLTVLSP